MDDAPPKRSFHVSQVLQFLQRFRIEMDLEIKLRDDKHKPPKGKEPLAIPPKATMESKSRNRYGVAGVQKGEDYTFRFSGENSLVISCYAGPLVVGDPVKRIVKVTGAVAAFVGTESGEVHGYDQLSSERGPQPPPDRGTDPFPFLAEAVPERRYIKVTFDGIEIFVSYYHKIVLVRNGLISVKIGNEWRTFGKLQQYSGTLVHFTRPNLPFDL